MNLKQLQSTQQALLNFVNRFKAYLGRTERLHWCWMYLSGLLLDGERKSIQPMAERLPGGNEQAMQQFVNQSPWNHEIIQTDLACFLAEQLAIKRGVLVLDDTTLPKKGRHSIGVGYQYCGVLGKLANCQSIVTWHYVAHHGEHFPLVGELFLPQSWTQDEERLKSYGVPDRRFAFKKKWELAYELLEHIPAGKLPYEAVVFDAGYGEVREFLAKLDMRGTTVVAYIPETHSFWPKDVALKTEHADNGRPRRYEQVASKSLKPLSAKQWRLELLKQGVSWQTIDLPLASKPSTQAMAVCVREVISQAFYRPGKERWLVIEKLGENNYQYYISNAPSETPLKQLVLWAHERYKVEQGYQQLKEELGLDHFEGRSWRGLHHHITLCFMAYAFLLLLKQQHVKKAAA